MADELQRALLLRDLELMGQPRNPNAVQPSRAGLLDLGVGLQERLGLLNQMFNPVEAIGGSMRAGREMMAPSASGYDRLASLGDMLSGVAGVVAPVAAGVRAGVPAATSLMESLLGGSPTQQAAGDMARQFGASEYGGVPVPGRNTQDIEDVLRSKYPDVKLSVSGSPERGYTLNKIDVPKAKRESGIGTAVMNDLVSLADQQGAVLKLSPSKDFGGSVPRLKDFYARFGFVQNKGKNADLAISESMYRPPSIQPLPQSTDAAAERGAQIMDMLRSGRAADVTDAMLDMGDPVLNARLNEYLYRNYDLPMGAASRAARATDFDASGYHGTRSDFVAFSPPQKAGVDGFSTQQPVFAGYDPSVANEAARPLGGNVIPLRARLSSVFDPATIQDAPDARWLDDSWSPLGRKLVDDAGAGRLGNDIDDPEGYAAAVAAGQWDVIESDAFQKWMRAQGFDDFRVNEAGAQNFAVTNPERIRSRFARFDPRLSHLRNLNAAMAAGVPLGLLAMQPEQEQY